MNILEAIVLGLVQGLAEFLPISSSGHLTLLQHVFGIEEAGLFLDVMLHIGTLVAVLFAYRKRLWNLICHPFQPQMLWLIVATIPAVLATLLLGDRIDALFAMSGAIGYCFLLTSVLLLVASRLQKRKGRNEVGLRGALTMGVFQALAIIPGLSRSGSTITGGMIDGVDREEAADFSFLMSIPAILGAFVLQLPAVFRGDALAEGTSMVAVIVGMVVAAVAGYLAIRAMLYVIRRVNLGWFALYTAVLGALVLLDANVLHIFF